MSTLLTVRAAADRLGIGYSTLKQWIYDGAVRTVLTRGGHHRLAELEVQRLLLSGAAPAAAGKSPAASGRTRAAGGARAKSSAARSAAQGEASGTTGVAAGAGRGAGSAVLISGRNQLRGVVEEVRGDGLLAQVRLRIGDQRLTAIITQDAVAELKLKRGDEALAVIKSTEVMIARERRRQ
jgi:molybdopterin-binding protein